jgi:transcriptional regulator with XRE-family HTH domain
MSATMRGVVKDLSPLSQLLLRAREQSGLKIARVAADADVSVQGLQHWETGRVKEPPLRGVLRVARVLGVSLEELEAAALGATAPAERAPGSARSRAEARAAAVREVDEELARAEGGAAPPPTPAKPRSRRSA